MSETFIKIDSLRHREISRRISLRTDQKSALQHSLFDIMLMFPNKCPPHIPPWLVHFNVSIDNVLHSKYAFKVILKCTSLAGMYGGH